MGHIGQGGESYRSFSISSAVNLVFLLTQSIAIQCYQVQQVLKQTASQDFFTYDCEQDVHCVGAGTSLIVFQVLVSMYSQGH